MLMAGCGSLSRPTGFVGSKNFLKIDPSVFTLVVGHGFNLRLRGFG